MLLRMDMKSFWPYLGWVLIAGGTVLSAAGWTGGPEFDSFAALGFSVMTIGVAMVIAAKVE